MVTLWSGIIDLNDDLRNRFCFQGRRDSREPTNFRPICAKELFRRLGKKRRKTQQVSFFEHFPICYETSAKKWKHAKTRIRKLAKRSGNHLSAKTSPSSTFPFAWCSEPLSLVRGLKTDSRDRWQACAWISVT